MTTSTVATNTYERSREQSPAVSASGLPKLFWAGSFLFACNAVVALVTLVSPELRVDMYGAEIDRATSSLKPSPFTEVVSTAPPRKIRTAERVRPVLFEPDPTQVDYAMAAFAGSLPRATEQARYASGSDVHAVVDRMSDYPRMTASIASPRPSVRPAHSRATDVSPPQVSEREVKPILNN